MGKVASKVARTVLVACLATAGAGLGTAPAASAPETRELLIRFGDASGTMTDGTRFRTAGTATTSAELRTHSGGNARAAVGVHGGKALRLPAFASGATAATVPLAVVAVTGSGLNPGTRPFVFGASFQLDASGSSAVDNGENLVQRGRYSAGSQYKLQVDKGRPTCRVRGGAGAVMVSAPRVERSQWYDVRCRRTRTGLRLQLRHHRPDGTTSTRAWTAAGRTGSLSGLPDRTPLAIGGKLSRTGRPAARDSDQFNGVVDSVFVDIRQ